MIQKCCPECGHKLVEKFLENEGMVPFCSECNAYRFPMFNVAVSMIVIDEDKKKILLIKQYGGKDYILVAGYVNIGEDLEHAARRELMEECNLEANEVLFNTSRYYPKSNSLMCNFIMVVKDSSKLKINHEIDEYAWFSKEDSILNIKKDSLAEYFLHYYLDK